METKMMNLFVYLKPAKKNRLSVTCFVGIKTEKKGKSCLWFPVVNSCVCRSWILHILNCIDLVTWSPITIMTRACWCPINLQLSFNSAEVKLGASSVFVKVLNTPELISTNRSMVHKFCNDLPSYIYCPLGHMPLSSWS